MPDNSTSQATEQFPDTTQQPAASAAAPAAVPAPAPAQAPAAPSILDAYDYDASADPFEPETLPATSAPPAAPVASSTTAPPASSPPAQAAAAPSPMLIAQALRHGLEEDEIAGLSPTELQRTVRVLDRQAAGFARTYTDELNRQALQQRQQPAAPAAAPEIDPDLGVPASALADFDPELVKALKHVGATASKVKKLEEELGHYRQRDQAREQDQTRERLDKYFDGVAATHEHIFGKGDGRKLNPQQREARHKVITGMVAFQETYKKLGQDAAEDQLFTLALNGLFGAEARQAAQAAAGQATQQPAPAAAPGISQQELQRRQAEWNNSALARPTSRAVEEPKGERRALNYLGAAMRERGLLADDDTTDINHFPG